LLIFVFIATFFAPARGVYDQFLKKAEVRHELIELEDSGIADPRQSTRALLVENKGNVDAKNIRLQYSLLSGQLLSTKIVSDEAYSISSSETTSNTLVVSLPRLSPGAQFIMLSESKEGDSTRPIETLLPSPYISVAFDGGVSLPSTDPTALESVENLGWSVQRGLVVMQEGVTEKTNARTLRSMTLNVLPVFGIDDFAGLPFANEQFRDALISVLLIVFLSYFLMPRAWAGLLTAILLGTLLWVFSDFTMNVIWLLLALILFEVAFLTTYSRRERFVIAAFFPVLFVLNVYYIGDSSEFLCLFQGFSASSNPLNCMNGQVPGGLTLMFLTIPIYLFVTDL